MLKPLYWMASSVAVLAHATFGCAWAADSSSISVDHVRLHQIETAVPASSGFVQRITDISSLFLGTPYVANTLVGGPQKTEQLVARLDAVDCYTFIDLVRALALSNNETDFIATLKRTRYRDGRVAYLNRRHFLTDWVALAPHNAQDITHSLSPQARVTHKRLNQRAGGGVFIQGLDIHPRDIVWLPPEALTSEVASKIHTGDVIGIYTPLAGLDVTHTGLAIWENGQLLFRNASSLKAKMQVVDTPLGDYLKGKPGFIVLRMREAD